MAEGILKRILHEARYPNVEVLSAGTFTSGGAHASENSVAACREIQVDLRGHRSRRLTRELIEQMDTILCMEHHHRAGVLELCPEAAERTHLLGEFSSHPHVPEIPDPVGLPLSYYRQCRDEIFDCLRTFFETLRKKNDGPHPLKLFVVAGKSEQQTMLAKTVEDCGYPVTVLLGDLWQGSNLNAEWLTSLQSVATYPSHSLWMIAPEPALMAMLCNKCPGVRAIPLGSIDELPQQRRDGDCNTLCLQPAQWQASILPRLLSAWFGVKGIDRHGLLPRTCRALEEATRPNGT